jgi:23S rRNA (uracil1939-C5)-methyltransferase
VLSPCRFGCFRPGEASLHRDSPIEIRIDSLAAGGDGVGRDAEGRVVFVALTAPGDLVRVRILKSRKRFARGEVLELLEPSPDRVRARCPAFGRCGGCAWQHVAYPAQIAAKSAIVGEALRRIGRAPGFDPVAVTPSPLPFGYRVRTRLVQEGARLGYRMRRSHRVCVVDACPVLDPRLEAVLGTDRPLKAEGLEPVGRGERGETVEWEAALGADGSVRVQRCDLAGAHVDLELRGDALRVSHGSFAQANGPLLSTLAPAVIREAAGSATGVGAVELYAGGGLFTLGLSRCFDQVWAIESHLGALADLRFNLQRAARSNVRVCPGSVESVLPALGIHAPEALVLDPPRSGVTPGAMEAIRELAAKRIVYLSCDPATLARDLLRLREHGYRLARVEAFDLFPQTPHVEVLATLER